MSKPYCVQLQAQQNISSGPEAFIVRGRFGAVLKNDRVLPKLSVLNCIVVFSHDSPIFTDFTD